MLPPLSGTLLEAFAGGSDYLVGAHANGQPGATSLLLQSIDLRMACIVETLRVWRQHSDRVLPFRSVPGTLH